MTSSSETEDDQFFDTREEISSASDLGSESESCPSNGVIDGAFAYDFWTKKPNSVRERRDNFFKLMGLSLDGHNNRTDGDEEDDPRHEDELKDFNRIMNDNEAVLASSDSEPITNDGVTEENATWKIKNLDNGTEFVVDKQDEDGSVTTFRELGSDKMISLDELQKTFGSSNLVQQLLRKDSSKGSNEIVYSKKKSRSSWLQRFSAVAHITDRKKGFLDKTNETNSSTGSGVRVRATKKHSKELSALYADQEFPAHEGLILTMKFSPDGRYLASGGVDGVVRVWKVLEDDNVNKFNAIDLDPSGLYFWLDNVSKVAPVSVVKENSSSARNSFESAPVVLPRKLFQLSEKPLHEFHGHEGEVLSLSWSKNGSLLSSSVDKTVRLWRVGNDNCLRVYSHNNYVTCVEFNPVDNNHFISGSIDGKIRIWEIEGGRVVDWTDIKEIVTAVSYSPDGKGGIVGSMDGNYRFYDVIDNRLELGAQMSLNGKKKLPGKRITGFQVFFSFATFPSCILLHVININAFT
ncbi:WD-repeat protein [Striga asiatica]|uniref:WD-repeat protein n=1 Tax=Striga asiatica TaxID=4170 RepID=A0A5A7NZ64_STRAF|nr:WD-repeat protein [Striga asiatica]